MIAYTADTRDPLREAAHLRFSAEIFPQLEEQGVRLARRLLDTGHQRPDLAIVLRRFRSQIEIFREENVPLFTELEELAARYQRLTGGITVEWDGQTLTLPTAGVSLSTANYDVSKTCSTWTGTVVWNGITAPAASSMSTTATFSVAGGVSLKRSEPCVVFQPTRLQSSLRATVIPSSGLASPRR